LEDLIAAFNEIMKALGMGEPFKRGSLKFYVLSIDPKKLEQLRKEFVKKVDDLFNDVDPGKAQTLMSAMVDRWG